MRDAVRAQFDAHKIDALFVTDKSNIFYLTGFRASNAFVLLTKNHQYLFTDARYLEKAEKVAKDDWRVIDLAPGMMNVIHSALMKHRVHRLGVEEEAMTVNLYKRFQALSGVKLVGVSRLVQAVRMVKGEDELRLLRQSQRLNEQVLKLLLPEIKTSVSEAELVWKLKLIAHDLGAQDMSFPPIIAFGAHTAIPHHESAHKKKLRRGDLVLIDMGLVYKEYASDMTRTFFTKAPTRQQAEVYNTVLEAKRRAIQAARPGAVADEVDKAARKFISDAGYKKKFGHATGHGIGLDVHELPFVSKGSEMVLASGMVITVEPGIYLPGKLGVRIEDMVEITAGSNAVLTKFPDEIEDVVVKV